MQKGDIFGIVIVVVLLIGVGTFFAFAPKAKPVVYAPVEITGSAVSSVSRTDENAVQVAAEIKQPGFVTVHQAIGEAPGPVIGNSPLLTVGSHANLIVETTEGLLSQTDYFVLLIVDDGDGVYEAGVDLPVMSGGEVIKEKLSL